MSIQIRNAVYADASNTNAVDVEIDHPEYGWISYTFIENQPDDSYDADIRAYLVNNTPTQYSEPVLTPQEQYQRDLALWHTDRTTAVENIEVTRNGVIYQGDEVSQGRLSRAILALPDDTTTTLWIAKDNSVHQLTRVGLKSILALSGAEQSRLWNLGRP